MSQELNQSSVSTLAISQLTKTKNQLTSFLESSDLLGNETAINQLKTEYQSAYNSFLDKYSDAKEEIKILNSELEILTEKIEKAEQSQAVEQERLDDLLSDKNQIVADITRLEQERNDIENNPEPQSILDEIKEIEADISNTENKISTKSEEKTQKNNLINSDKTEKNKLIKQRDEHIALAEEYDSQSEITYYVKESWDYVIVREWVEPIIYIDENKIALRDQEYTKADQIKKKIDEFTKKIDNLANIVTQLNSTIDGLKNELASDTKNLQGQKDLLNLKQSQIEDKLAQKDLEIQQKSQNLVDLNTEITQQQETVDNASQKTNNLTSEFANQQEEYTTLSTILTIFETQANYLLTEDFTDFLDWNIDIDQQFEDLKQKVVNLDSQIQPLETELIETQQQYQSNQENLDNLLQEKNTLTVAINSLESKKSSVQNNYAQQKKIEETINTLNNNVNQTSTNITNFTKQINDKNNLINQYKKEKEEFLEEYDSHISTVEYFKNLSTTCYRCSREQRIKIYSERAEIAKQEADNLQSKINTLNTQINNLNSSKNQEQTKFNDYKSQLNTQNQLLSQLESNHSSELTSIDSQIQQKNSTLGNLNTNIFQQENLLNNLSQDINNIEQELDDLYNQKTLAEQELTIFEENNIYLSAVNLKKHILAVEKLDVIEDRLTSLESLAKSEADIANAIENGDYDSYSTLDELITTEISQLTDIWTENLEDSHNFTLSVYDLIQQRSQAVDNVIVYIEDNLADYHSDYILAKIDVGIAIDTQEVQVKYRDGLAESLDNLEEAVEVLELRVQQLENIDNKLEHFSELTTLETQYNNQGNQAEEDFKQGFIDVLNQEIIYKQEGLTVEIDLTDDQLEESLEIKLADYLGNKKNKIGEIANKDEVISAQQNLRIEITYLIQEANQDPNKLQEFLSAYQNSNKTLETIDNLLNSHYPLLSQQNTLDELRQQINEGLAQSQTDLNDLQEKINNQQAESLAILSQAQWYEEQARIHWNRSKKQGPTWVEYRTAKGKSGKTKTVTVTHVDHDWILYDQFTQQALNLRENATILDLQTIADQNLFNITENVISQWQEANAAADSAELTLEELEAQLEQLEAQRELLPEYEAQLETFQQLIPTLQGQLETAHESAESAKTNTINAQTEFDQSSDNYETALIDVLQEITTLEASTLEANTQNLLQHIATSRTWVEYQMIELDTEINQTIAEVTKLEEELAGLAGNDEELAKIREIQNSIDWLKAKQAVLTAEKASFTQKLTLLEAQKDVIQKEEEYLLATLQSPDGDYSNLEELLQRAEFNLEQAQALAEQAEADSVEFFEALGKLQSFLEIQNDAFLDEIKAKQEILQDLIDNIELKENYTLEATKKQIEVNTIETELLLRMEQMAEAGLQEAEFLLEVAANENFAAVAELYSTDYRDLMNDTGGSCSGGIATPEDAQKAEFYYQEMLKYQALQAEAQQQADLYAQVQEATQVLIENIEQEQGIAQQELDDILTQIDNTQDVINDLQQELNIAEMRLDSLQYLRNYSETILVQLLQVGELNLAQAQLEQKIAEQLQGEINEALMADFQRQQAQINRERAIATAKIEHLNQLEAEDGLEEILKDVKIKLGQEPVEDLIQTAEYKGQLAGILSDLENLQQKPDLPPEVKTLLGATMADIDDALQGKEAATIQENLIKTANALNNEAVKLQAEINELDAEEIELLNILSQSETDLQTASKNLYEEIVKGQELGEKYQEVSQEYLQILYQIGYAEGAIDLSSELAQQSKSILEEIIEGRIEERKIREKAAFNEIFGTVILVISVAAAVFTAGASLAAGSFVQPTVSTVLTTISSGLSAVQAAYNGDWSGAIFNAGMAALGGASLAKVNFPDLGGVGLDNIKDFGQVQQIASGVYNGYQAFEAGDGITGFLNLVGASFNLGLPQYSFLAQAGLSIHSGVQLAEEDDWLGAVSSFLNAGFVLGSSLKNGEGSSALSTQLLDVISTAEIGTNIISAIDNISDDDSLEGWLNGITSISNSLTNYVKEQKTVDILTDFKKLLENEKIIKKPDLKDRLNDTNIQALIAKYGEDNVFIVYLKDKFGKLIKQPQPYITKDFDLNTNNKGGFMIRGDFDENKPTLFVTHGWNDGLNSQWSLETGELLAKLYPNRNIIIADWSELSKDVNFLSAASDTKLVGQTMTEELLRLGVDFTQLEIIGHSLGAQVAGAIGEYTQNQGYGEVKRIIGLDPANPGFESSLFLFEKESNEGRLDAGDAKDVMLIRSDYDWIFSLGYRNPRGSQDIKLTSEMLEHYPGIDHGDAIRFLIDGLDRGYSLDNIDQFFAIKNQELSPQPNQPKPSKANTQSLNNIKIILNKNSGTLNYNNPLGYYIKSSGSSFGSYQANNNQILPLDPLVIDLDGNGLELSDLETSNIFFDIDADGYAENVSWTTDGILTVDLNGDGTINDITEIFSEYFNDGSANSGLEALIAYDSNGNGIISDNDTQYNQILVWQDLNQNGISEPEELKTLAEHGITSINLNGIEDEFIQDGNIIKKRSFFNRADGTSGEISDVAFLVTQTGFQVNQTATGTQITAEDDSAISLFIHEEETALTLNLADAGVQVAIGNNGNDYLFTTNNQAIFMSGEAGNDILEGGGGDDWLVGGEGADQLKAGAGDDLLYIDAQDTFIDGGEGTDIAIVATADGVTLDINQAKLEMIIGNDGDDNFSHTGDYTVVMIAEGGSDRLSGGSGDDVITGGEGEDTITGGLGADILTGGEDADTFIYNDIAESTADNPDTITDFEVGTDIIEIYTLSLNFSDLTITIEEGNKIVTSNTNNFGLLLEGELQLTANDFIFSNSTPVNNPPIIT